LKLDSRVKWNCIYVISKKADEQVEGEKFAHNYSPWVKTKTHRILQLDKEHTGADYLTALPPKNAARKAA